MIPQPWNGPLIDPEMIPTFLLVDPEMIPKVLGPDYMSWAGPVKPGWCKFAGILARLLNAIKINFATTWQPGQPD